MGYGKTIGNWINMGMGALVLAASSIGVSCRRKIDTGGIMCAPAT